MTESELRALDKMIEESGDLPEGYICCESADGCAAVEEIPTADAHAVYGDPLTLEEAEAALADSEMPGEALESMIVAYESAVGAADEEEDVSPTRVAISPEEADRRMREFMESIGDPAERVFKGKFEDAPCDCFVDDSEESGEDEGWLPEDAEGSASPVKECELGTGKAGGSKEGGPAEPDSVLEEHCFVHRVPEYKPCEGMENLTAEAIWKALQGLAEEADCESCDADCCDCSCEECGECCATECGVAEADCKGECCAADYDGDHPCSDCGGCDGCDGCDDCGACQWLGEKVEGSRKEYQNEAVGTDGGVAKELLQDLEQIMPMESPEETCELCVYCTPIDRWDSGLQEWTEAYICEHNVRSETGRALYLGGRLGIHYTCCSEFEPRKKKSGSKRSRK